MSYRMSISEDGTARVSGIDYGPMKVHKITNDHVVVKNRGHKYWSSIGRQGYSASRFIVFRIVDRHADNQVFVEHVIDFQIRT